MNQRWCGFNSFMIKTLILGALLGVFLLDASILRAEITVQKASNKEYLARTEDSLVKLLQDLGLPKELQNQEKIPLKMANPFLANLEPELSELYQMIQQHNPNLKQLQLQKSLAEAESKSSQGLFHPRIYAKGQYSREKRGLNSNSLIEQDGYNYGLTLEQNLFAGGADLKAYQISEMGLAIAELKYTKEEEILKARLVKYLYNWLAAEGQKRLKESFAQQAQNILDLTQRKEQAGIVSKTDIMLASAQRNLALLESSKAQGSVENAWLMLNSIFSQGWQQNTEKLLLAIAKKNSVREILNTYSGPWPQVPRPTMEEKIAQLTLAQSEKNLSAAYGTSYAPSVDLFANFMQNHLRSYSVSSVTDSSATGDTIGSTSVGLSMTWKIWNYQDRAQISEKSTKVRIAQTDLVMAADQVRLTSDKMERRLRQLYLEMNIGEKTFLAHEQVYAANLRLYQAGASDLARLIDAQRQLLTVLSGWFETFVELKQQRLSFDLAMKGILSTNLE